MSKSIPIGLTKVHVAILLTDIAGELGTNGITTYDVPIRVPGAITANFSPNASNDTIFADDGPYDTASTLGAMSLELNVADLPAELRALILGATYDAATGLLIHTSEDIPPYLAVGMSVMKSNGASRLIWYLKGKFSAPDDSNQTKADSINWNTPTITGNFLKRDSDNQWRISCDTDDLNTKTPIKDHWFETPNVAGILTNMVETPTAVPATGAVVTPGTTTIVLSCATVGAVISYKKSTTTVYTEYTAPIDTTDFTGTTVLNVKAVLDGKITSAVNLAYTIA